MQLEKHQVSVRKGMIATTEDWDGNEVVSEEDQNFSRRRHYRQ